MSESKIMGNANTKKQSFAVKMDLQRQIVDAVKLDNVQRIRDLIYYEHVDPNILTLPSGHRWRPIHYAAVYGSYNSLTLLMERYNVSPNQKDAYGWLPIHLSVFNGHVQCTRLLLHYKSLQPKTDRDYPGKHGTKKKTPRELAHLIRDYRHMELFNENSIPCAIYVHPLHGESGK